MKSYTLLFILIALFNCSCQVQKPTNAEIVSRFLELLRSDSIKNYLDSTNSISATVKSQVFEQLRKQIYYVNGGPLPDSTFRKMKDSNTHPDSTKWVFYYKKDIETVLSTLPSGCSNCGIRMYLKNHESIMPTSNSNPHPFAGRATIVLRAAFEGVDITNNANALYDYGDVCPPNCNVNCDYECRTLQDYKDGISCDKKWDPSGKCK
ncbi:MAG: hypothetical protein U0V49_14605 [Saprospiraceae bacterium]